MSDTTDKIQKYVATALGWDTGLVAKKSQGIYVTTEDGETYMDFTSGVAVLNVGHSHPRVIARAKEQLENYLHSGCVFKYESMAHLSELLAEVAPGDIEMFFFSNSGSEVVEGALKLARYVTGRQGIISFRGAFHGRSLGATSITTSAAKYRRFYRPLLGEVYRALFPYVYRHPEKDEDKCVDECIDFIHKLFKHEIMPDEVACFIIEPQQGEGGYIPAPTRFLRTLRDICDEHGILLIFDEVQTGFGRTGKFFAAEHSGVNPDVICMGKSIAGGLPLAALGATRKIMEAWPPGAHGTTFGGNPVCCAAAIGVIEAIREDNLLEQGMKLGEMMKERFTTLQKDYPVIGDVRGLGCMFGVELVKEDGAPDGDAFTHLFNHAMNEKLVILCCGPDGNVIRLIPPLVTTEDEMNKALDILEAGIKSYKQ